jgi:hypothetical protein
VQPGCKAGDNFPAEELNGGGGEEEFNEDPEASSNLLRRPLGIGIPTTAGAASIPVTCGTQSGGNPNLFPSVPVNSVRVGTHDGYDRFVIEFAGSQVPGWTAIPKSSANFTKDPSGLPITLEGTAGIKLVVQPVQRGSYTGPIDFDTEFPQLAEACRLGDNEGVFSWGLGLTRQSCKRIFTLSSPTRLVVDVPN